MKRKFIIGIDLGGTNLKIGLLNSRYRILKKNILNTRKFIDKEKLIRAITDSVRKLERENNLSKKEILGVGLGLPGPINSQRGIVHFLPNIPGWKDVNLTRILTRKLKLPVFIDNDANLMCIAEHTLGAARGAKNALCLTLGTGVGGGIILDSQIYRGASFSAGEIGHIPINEDGPRCNCGGKACLEAYIGNTRLLTEARRFFKGSISLEKLSILAGKKNKTAVRIWKDMGRRLGLALSGVVNLLNPDCIVIGGGVAGAGKILFDGVKDTIAKQAMPVPARHLKLLKARLGSDAGIIGAAILVKQGRGKTRG